MEQQQAAENLSQWFDLDEQKPWEPGFYEVDIKEYTRDRYSAYSFWDGVKFSQPCVIGFKHAEESKTWQITQAHRIYKWRGLAFDPSAKHKPKARGNRRVTRYVVMAQHKITMAASCDGSFESKKNAESRMAQTLKICGDTHRMWIQKVRFRTPEAA